MMHWAIVVWLVLIGAVAAADAPSIPIEPGTTNTMGAAESPPLRESYVRIDLRRALGADGARVAIVEFADYQCPYCRAYHVQTLPKLQAQYIATGKVRYFYKDFPIPGHPQAVGAGIAAYCAGARYWEMQDLLYTEQARLGSDLYEELAEELKLHRGRFKTCLKSRAARRAVETDRADAQRLGLTGTPSFVFGYLEGDRVRVVRKLSGARTFDTFAREIDALLNSPQ